jgi:hypothetical protein
MNTIVREDDFEGTMIHTFTHDGRACWLLSEIEQVLGEEVDDFDPSYGGDAIPGDDYVCLDGEDADDLLSRLGHPSTTSPITVIYKPGLSLACAALKVGLRLRRFLLQEAAKGVEHALRREGLEYQVRELVKQFAAEDRARKASLLRALVHCVRSCEALGGDDAGYGEMLALVAEVATGLSFPTGSSVDMPIPHGVGVTDVRVAANEPPPFGRDA